ncbi:MAG: chromosomal replication initiator protein DnaA [Patescibacteria group bacterium]|nr:chromosomal replication initiator protein DnaA [Patescibacteria group bacterium]
MNNEQLWQAILGEIEVAVSRASFTTWFKQTFIGSFENGNIVICVPNVFTKAWLEKKYHTELINAFKNITKEPVIKIIYKIETKKEDPNAPVVSYKKEKDEGGHQETVSSFNFKPSTLNKFGLNTKYNFDSFIVGKNNKLAHAAALAVGKNPGVAYNPLVIYGGVGLGKTHLLQAIGNELSKKTDKILYVTSEKFTNDYINEVKSGRAKFLKDKYRNVDLLLIDDIQFLGGKDGTQEEFFHTFNELHQANKQIVVTCDRPLKTIPALEERLLSRLEWGMVADITLPDFETRIAILQNKCHERNYLMPEKIINYLAQNIQTNIRELEGALTKLITYFEFNNLSPDINVIRELLSDNLVSTQATQIGPLHIIEATGKYYNILSKDILGQSRKKELVKSRQIVMYLLREEVQLSFPSIGQELGNRDHTTVMHACRKIKRELEKNEKLLQEIESIKQIFKNI